MHAVIHPAYSRLILEWFRYGNLSILNHLPCIWEWTCGTHLVCVTHSTSSWCPHRDIRLWNKFVTLFVRFSSCLINCLSILESVFFLFYKLSYLLSKTIYFLLFISLEMKYGEAKVSIFDTCQHFIAFPRGEKQPRQPGTFARCMERVP